MEKRQALHSPENVSRNAGTAEPGRAGASSLDIATDHADLADARLNISDAKYPDDIPRDLVF